MGLKGYELSAKLDDIVDGCYVRSLPRKIFHNRLGREALDKYDIQVASAPITVDVPQESR